MSEPENAGLGVARRPDGTWPPGQSGNPAGGMSEALRGKPKIGYWLNQYLAGEDISHAPPLVLKLVKAMVRDAISKPTYDKEGNLLVGPGCSVTRSQILDRVEGPVVKEAKITRQGTVQREIVLVDPSKLRMERPPWPKEVQEINDAEEKAREDAGQRRADALGEGANEPSGNGAG